jgi:hypothetical protein
LLRFACQLIQSLNWGDQPEPFYLLVFMNDLIYFTTVAQKHYGPTLINRLWTVIRFARTYINRGIKLNILRLGINPKKSQRMKHRRKRDIRKDVPLVKLF